MPSTFSQKRLGWPRILTLQKKDSPIRGLLHKNNPLLSLQMKKADAQDAAILAKKIHQGQTLPNGKPYFEHLEAVASIAENLYMEEISRVKLTTEKLLHIMTEIDIIRQTAFLHDCLENHPKQCNPTSLLKAGIHPRAVEAILHLTKNKSLSYEDNILRAAENPLSRLVKRADNAHNSKTQRLPSLLKTGMSLEKLIKENTKYTLSYLFLSEAINESTYRKEMAKLQEKKPSEP